MQDVGTALVCWGWGWAAVGQCQGLWGERASTYELGDTIQSIPGIYYLLNTYFAPGAEPNAVLYISDRI